MCGGQNSLSKGGLNAKAGFCYPYNNRYISFLPSDDEAYYKDGYCTKCKAQMPTEVLHGKISQRSIKFCFNCGAKINGVLWTLIEEGIIKEK